MTTESKTIGFTVEGTLTGVQPKAGGKADAYNPKPNSVILTIEVEMPRPDPPKSFDDWLQAWSSGRDPGGRSLKENLQRDLDTFAATLRKEANKLGSAGKKPKHWFATQAGPGEAVTCKHCNLAAPDGEVCLDGDHEREVKWQAAQPAVDPKRHELNGQLMQAYQVYFDEKRTKLNGAFAAALGTGLFVVMLNQKLQLTMNPSSEIFQPMLLATEQVQAAIPEQFRLEAGVQAGALLTAPGQESATDDEVEGEEEGDEE